MKCNIVKNKKLKHKLEIKMTDFIKLLKKTFSLIVFLLVVILCNQNNVKAEGECNGGVGGTCAFPLCCSK